jgi:DNA-binding NtrC family response regulator
MVQEGEFREDLFYRLTGFEITLPPLRDRDRDVIALAKMILEREEDHRGKRLSRGAERLLLEYPWPGNIRELQNVIRRAALYSIRGRIPEEAVRGALRFPVAGALTPDQHRQRILELVRGHRRIMESALRAELGTSRHRNLQILEELERNGLIDRHGRGSGTYYTAVDAVGRHDLSRRQRIALEHAKTTGSITRSKYQRLTGATERSARRELADLVARGLLRVCGRGRTCRYETTTS